MILKSKIADFLLRVVIGMLIGSVFGFALSEITYAMTPGKSDAVRPPQEVLLVIPYGTSAQMEAGLYTLPAELQLVEGDVLIVKNEDVVPHQLGPLFIPSNTSSALSLDMANEYMYECSFQKNERMGLTVLPRPDSSVKLQGVLAIGMPTGMMLALYSYMFSFGKKKTPSPA